MGQAVWDKTVLDRFAIDFALIVEKYARYIVVSGFVAIAHGRTRGTEDVDMIIERIDEARFCRLHEQLASNGFECIQSEEPRELYRGYLAKNTSIRYVRKGEHLPQLELKFAKDALDDYQLKTRKRLPFTGLDIYFSSAEANIAFKEELLKSEKDVEDARHLRIVYEGKINEQEISRIKAMIRRMRLR